MIDDCGRESARVSLLHSLLKALCHTLRRSFPSVCVKMVRFPSRVCRQPARACENETEIYACCRLPRSKNRRRLRPLPLPTAPRERKKCAPVAAVVLGACVPCRSTSLSDHVSCAQKWSKGKQKDKANNMVLFDQVRPLCNTASAFSGPRHTIACHSQAAVQL